MHEAAEDDELMMRCNGFCRLGWRQAWLWWKQGFGIWESEALADAAKPKRLCGGCDSWILELLSN